MAVERSQEHILGRALAVVPIPVSAIAHPSSRPTPTDGLALTVVLIDAATGLPYVASGGGGGGSAQMTATAAAPTYVEGSSTNPLSSNLTGDLRVIAKQNGTWTVGLSAGSAAIGSATATGNVAHDAADTGNPVKVGGRATAAAPAAVANGDRSDFFTDLLGSLRTLIVDGAGAPLDYTIPAITEGPAVAGTAVGTLKPTLGGGRGSTANPTAVTDGQIQRLMLDKVGRTATVPHQIRDLCADTAITITSTTTAADLIAAVASTSVDIVSVTMVNTSATGTAVQILNADGTTVRWTGYCPPTDMRGIVLPVPLKGAALNSKWMAKTLTSVSAVTITVQYVLNT